MTAVIVGYTFKCVLTFYILQEKPPKRRGTRGNLPPPPTLSLDGPGCVNNALVNALKKLQKLTHTPLLLVSNRKSYTGFRLPPRAMTLDDREL